MDLKEQRYVVVLAECESITRAAAQLNISQPALSIYIGNLENLLGVKLFNRIGKRFVLTYAGELYVENAKQILLLGSNFDAKLSEITRGYKGRLRIGVPIRRSPYIIPKLLTRFNEYYPNIEVVIHEGNTANLEDLLLKNELDLLLCNRTTNKSDMEYISIYDDKLLLAVSSVHPLSNSGMELEGYKYPWINLKKFNDDLFILQHSGQSIRFFVDKMLEEVNIKPKKTIKIRNIETSTQLAAIGYGVSFILESYAKHFHYENPPIFFMVGDQKTTVDFVVAYKKGIYLPSYTMKFIDILKQIM